MDFISIQDIKIWDILDVLIVAYLIYLVYKLLRGTIAFNIFIGVILIYLIYWLVGALEMKLLSTLLGKFVGFGVLFLIIIFQPEVRKFLLLLGNTTLRGRFKFVNKFIKGGFKTDVDVDYVNVGEVKKSVAWLSKEKMGALIVIGSAGSQWRDYANNGEEINSDIKCSLVESIFFKNSPLHDGAMIIIDKKIAAVSAVLPLSDRASKDGELGLRHRAALGVSESTDALVIIVSEETGDISYAYEGKLHKAVGIAGVTSLLEKNL